MFGKISTCSSFDFDSYCGGSDVLGVVLAGFLDLETCFVNFFFLALDFLLRRVIS
jgi:hypothetical protein